MNYVTEFQVCALVIIFVISLYYFTTPRFPLRQNRMFTMLLIVSMIGSICDIISVYTVAYSDGVPRLISGMFNIFSYVCLLILPVIFFEYISNISKKKTYSHVNKFSIPTFAILVILIFNHHHHLFFYIEPSGVFVKGILFWTLPLNLLYYVFLTLILVANTDDMNLIGKRRNLISICGVYVICITIEVMTNKYLLTGLATAISILIVYLSLQNPADMIDDMTGAYNKNSFQRYIDDIDEKNAPTSIVFLNIDETRILNVTYGMTTGNMLLADFANYLMTSCHKSMVFRIDGDQFAIISNSPEICLDNVHAIQKYFSTSHHINNLDIRLTAGMCYLTDLKRMSNNEDLLVVMEYMMSKTKAKGKATILEINADAMKDRERELNITSAFREAVENETLGVYLQPIYSIREQKFISAEALSRFSHPILGHIPPDEFIRLAEENGLIVKMGLLVLKKVCIFLQMHPELLDTGMKGIEINLSAIELVQDNFAEKILSVVEHYGIDPHHINFEITESTASTIEKYVRRNMLVLKKHGFTFSMDDFGTGYSNLDSIVGLPFSIIKIDRSMLLGYFKSYATAVLFLGTIDMIQDLNLEVVVEGAETQEHIDLLHEHKIDYIQGYYYSRPLPMEDFVEFIMEKNK